MSQGASLPYVTQRPRNVAAVRRDAAGGQSVEISGIPAKYALSDYFSFVFCSVDKERGHGLYSGHTARRPALRKYLVPSHVGRFINDLRDLAEVLIRLPSVDRSRDPGDNFLLAMAEASNAEYLVTGDKRDVLALDVHGRTRIVTTRQMLAVLNL